MAKEVNGQVTTILAAAAATGVGDSYQLPRGVGKSTFQASVAGTGEVSATVDIEVSNDDASWVRLATITLSGTTSNSDGFANGAPWAYARANVTAISGTEAAVSVKMGV